MKKIACYFSILIFSCASGKDIVYYQSTIWESRKKEIYEIKIQPDDLLSIIVSAEGSWNYMHLGSTQQTTDLKRWRPNDHVLSRLWIVLNSHYWKLKVRLTWTER
jgi:hypothetical protein